jgi:hypothetical protein
MTCPYCGKAFVSEPDVVFKAKDYHKPRQRLFAKAWRDDAGASVRLAK